MLIRRDALARYKLRELGVKQGFGARWADVLILGIGVITAAAIGIIPKRYPDVFVDFSGLASSAIAASVATVALRQWRHLRNEATIAGALGRLDLVNSYFIQMERFDGIRALFEGGHGWQESTKDPKQWMRDMYVFVELDNLQYGLEKYRLGYCTPYQALRSVDLFAARCQSEAFLQAARRLTQERAGSYTDETLAVVGGLQSGTRFLPLGIKRAEVSSNKPPGLTGPLLSEYGTKAATGPASAVASPDPSER